MPLAARKLVSEELDDWAGLGVLGHEHPRPGHTPVRGQILECGTDPDADRGMLVAKHTEASPIVQLLGHELAAASGMRPRECPHRINERFAVLVSRRAKRSRTRSGVGFVERARVIECRLVRHAGPCPTLQPARSMTVPQRVHVRRSRFRIDRSNTGGNCFSMSVSSKNSS